MVNFLFLISGIVFVLNRYKNSSGKRVGYFEGLGIGCLATLIAIIPFGIFMDIYLHWDTAFMAASLAVCVEGISSGLISSFMIMQYLKRYERVSLRSGPNF